MALAGVGPGGFEIGKLGTEDGRHLFRQIGREHGHNLPQEFVVEAGVIVHDAVAYAGDALPQNLGVALL